MMSAASQNREDIMTPFPRPPPPHHRRIGAAVLGTEPAGILATSNENEGRSLSLSLARNPGNAPVGRPKAPAVGGSDDGRAGVSGLNGYQVCPIGERQALPAPAVGREQDRSASANQPAYRSGWRRAARELDGEASRK